MSIFQCHYIHVLSCQVGNVIKCQTFLTISSSKQYTDSRLVYLLALRTGHDIIIYGHANIPNITKSTVECWK